MSMKRLHWPLWLAVLVLSIGVWLYPISSRFTRASGAALFALLWIGLIGLVWRVQAARVATLTLTVPAGAFLAMPRWRGCDAEALRSGNVAGLLRYEGVRYFWGGESPRGIDCSGLIRRGLIDSLFLRGVRAVDGALVRHALWLWWHDCTARDIGDNGNMTAPLLDTPSINALDPARIAPGDIAVTANGVHIMAFLGCDRWIEADPAEQSVLVVTVPSRDNPWFQQPMKVVRWNVLWE